MKNLILILLLPVSISLSAQKNKKEEAAIKEIIQAAYIDGVFNKGDTAAMLQGFHPDFRLIGQNKDATMRTVGLQEWLDLVLQRQAKGAYPPVSEKIVTVRFLQIDISETVASVKLEFWVGGKKEYIDYLQLYRNEAGLWQIINKVYIALGSVR